MDGYGTKTVELQGSKARVQDLLVLEASLWIHDPFWTFLWEEAARIVSRVTDLLPHERLHVMLRVSRAVEEVKVQVTYSREAIRLPVGCGSVEELEVRESKYPDAAVHLFN